MKKLNQNILLLIIVVLAVLAFSLFLSRELPNIRWSLQELLQKEMKMLISIRNISLLVLMTVIRGSEAGA